MQSSKKIKNDEKPKNNITERNIIEGIEKVGIEENYNYSEKNSLTLLNNGLDLNVLRKKRIGQVC